MPRDERRSASRRPHEQRNHYVFARDADLGSVAATLARQGIHAVCVLDDEGNPTGVVTDFDLLAGEWLADDAEGLQTMRAITAAELMTSPVETIGADAPAAEAAAHMRQLRLSRLLVTDERGSAVGVISVSDLVAPLGSTVSGRGFVRDVMSHAIVTCPAETSLEAAEPRNDRAPLTIVLLSSTKAAKQSGSSRATISCRSTRQARKEGPSRS